MWIGSLVIYQEHAYIPVMAKMVSGGYVVSPPVEIVELTTDQLTVGLQRAKDRGNPLVPDIDASRFQDAILLASGARSWKQLARMGASYGIMWDEDTIEIDMSKLDPKGRFVDDPAKKQRLQTDVAMSAIANLILSDWNSRTGH